VGRALDAWLSVRKQKKGPLFRSFSPRGELREVRIDGRVVAAVVKRLFRDLGASESEVGNIAAHSLRRGFVTSADMAGATTAHTRRELLDGPALLKLFATLKERRAEHGCPAASLFCVLTWEEHRRSRSRSCGCGAAVEVRWRMARLGRRSIAR
jgi:hypothetical protein